MISVRWREEGAPYFFSNNIVSWNVQSNKFYFPLLRKEIVFCYYVDISGRKISFTKNFRPRGNCYKGCFRQKVFLKKYET